MPLYKTTLIVVFCVVCFSAHGQRSINIHDHLLIRDSNRYLYGLMEEKYEGSPFLNDDLVVGHVYVGTGKYNGVPMRYNIFADVMEFQDRGQIFLLEPDPRIKRIEIGDHVFVVENFKYLSKKQNGFIELMENGKLSLLSKKAVNHREKNELKGIPAKYSRLPDVYFYKIDGQVIKVGNVKNLIESLPDKQQEVSAFVKNEKISPKNGDDLLKLVRFYNGLFAVK